MPLHVAVKLIFFPVGLLIYIYIYRCAIPLHIAVKLNFVHNRSFDIALQRQCTAIATV